MKAKLPTLGPLHKHLGHFANENVLREGHNTVRTIEPKHKGQHKIKFHEGGLHKLTHTPPGQPISEKKHEEAKAGKFGPRAEKDERFYENVLKGRGGRRKK